MNLDFQFRLNSYLAIIFGVLVIIGETFRRFGDLGHWSRWMDDYIIGLFLIVSAILILKGNNYGKKIIIGAWGFSSGLLYGSFFSKITDVHNVGQTNIDPNLLVILIGLGFFIATISLIWVLILVKKESYT